MSHPRCGCRLTPSQGAKVEPFKFTVGRPTGSPPQQQMGDHWKNFLGCVRTRRTPTSDMENMAWSAAVCAPGIVSIRVRTRLDFDEDSLSVRQPEALPLTRIDYRAPWKSERRDAQGTAPGFRPVGLSTSRAEFDR